MTIHDFSKTVELTKATEIEKVKLLAFFFHKTTLIKEFTLIDVEEWFDKLHFHKPNRSRLKGLIQKSHSFVKGVSNQSWRLHARDLDKLQSTHPDLTSEGEEIVSVDTLLPQALYDGSRGFIESLAKQINASYEYNIFDGCAVLMRRLLEVLLILTYEHCGVEKDIQDATGTYWPLEKITSNAKTHQVLKLSRGGKNTIDEFRTLGNFAAHKIYFVCRRADIKKIASEYRATIEELLYKSGIRQ